MSSPSNSNANKIATDREPPTGQQPRKTLWLAVFLLVGLCTSLVSIMAALLSSVLGPVFLLGGLVAGSVFLVTAFHYLVWGWWLGDWLRQAEEAEEND